MTRVIFHNLASSDFVRDSALRRLESISEKFPVLQDRYLELTLSMENSPHKPGPDAFSARLRFFGPRRRPLVIERSSENLYQAMAEVVDRAHERLSRATGRERDRRRDSMRRLKSLKGAAHAKNSA